MDNQRTGFFDKNIMSKGNPDASLVNRTKNALGSGIGSIMDFMGNIPTPLNLVRKMMNQDPKAPSYKTYSPNIDYSKLNTVNLNDFYDSNPDSETYDTTRFDRAKPGSFASYRTLADYFNRNKKKAENIGIDRAAKKEAAKQAKIDAANTAAARQAYMARAQRTADRRDPGQGNTVTGFGKSGLGRDPNDRM